MLRLVMVHMFSFMSWHSLRNRPDRKAVCPSAKSIFIFSSSDSVVNDGIRVSNVLKKWKGSSAGFAVGWFW